MVDAANSDDDNSIGAHKSALDRKLHKRFIVRSQYRVSIDRVYHGGRPD
jgi:hypothetical protein